MLLYRGCAWLTLTPFLLSLSTGELGFYRDALPETAEDIALKHVARYLEAQRLQQRLHRSHLSSFLSPVHKKHVQNEPYVDKLLVNNAALKAALLRQQKLKTWARHHRLHQYHEPINRGIDEREHYLLPHLDFSEMKEPNDEDVQDYRSGLGYEYRTRTDGTDVDYGRSFDVDKGMMEETMNFRGTHYGGHDHAGALDEDDKEIAVQPPLFGQPKFTYKFDDSNLEEKHPFAVKPNDPRYYSDTPFSSDEFDRHGALNAYQREKEKLAAEVRESMKHEDNLYDDQKIPEDLTAIVAPETSAANHPLIVPVNNDFNNDTIYFIAVVAGCSAAAMFTLVLASLTWYRLQRGAKAAADIEYPAYGVTGPNKDVSPSGDQRLAQSAQMYHFQHQKQQIIAMESRSSATRDPGSLSEAESDEENEEGDYTVYECPGLASTGEMEVKNPIFHDPTPATPAKSNNKEEDHM